MGSNRAKKRPPCVFAYCRVSDSSSSHTSVSIESQIDSLVQYRHYRLSDIQWSTDSYPEGSPEGFFIDRGVSAYEGSKLAKRPAGAVLMSLIQKGDHLVVWSIDRLFRNVGDYGTTLDTFKKMGVTVHFVRDGLNLSTASGQLKADILAVMAQHWSRMISFRTKEAYRIKMVRKGHNYVSQPDPPVPRSRDIIDDYLDAKAAESAPLAMRPTKRARKEIFKAGNRVWGYVRVSHTGQVESGLGLEHQQSCVDKCMDDMVAQGSRKMEIIADEAVSSFKVPFAERPGGKRILSEATAGDVVVVYRFDRIFRSLGDAIRQIAEFRQRGIALRLIEEDIQTNDTTSDWYLSLLGTFAELESQIKGERIAEAMQKKKKLGLRHTKRLMIYKPVMINGQSRWRLNVPLLVKTRMAHILYNEHRFSVEHSCHIVNALSTDYGDKWVHFVFNTKKGERDDAITPNRFMVLRTKWNEIMELLGDYAARRIEKKARDKLAAGISEHAFLICKRARVPVERLKEVMLVRIGDGGTANTLSLGNGVVPLPGVEDL